MSTSRKSDEFLQECREWLSPLGYTVHAFNGHKTSIYFTNDSRMNAPSIRCMVSEGGRKEVELIGSLPKLFISINAGPLSFKHPDIEEWIDQMEWYSIVCTRFKGPAERIN